MKNFLYGGVSLFAAGLVTSPALAEEGIKLAVGGFFKEAYQVVFDDDGEGELGNERNTDGFFNDAEIHFVGSTVLDNGLEVGVRVELEGETDDDQVDEAWVWFSGGFGEIRIGSEDDALANACIVPPGGTGNFSAFSPNQWGANSSGGGFFFGASSNSICTGVDDRSDAQKVVYITPSFSGFQLTASYTPNPNDETHADGAGPHLGMPTTEPGVADAAVSAYLTYSYEGEDWGLTAGGGGSWEINNDDEAGFTFAAQDFYQAGINLSIGNFGIGIAGEYYNDATTFTAPFAAVDADGWVAGIGASYAMDAWTFGLQYSHRDDDVDLESPLASSFDSQQDRVVATANYALGPGINIDGEIGYTWIDTDPEAEDFSLISPEGVDDYQALEFGIGTSITF